MFTAVELAYLRRMSLGRLATLGPDGAPHVQPVVYWVTDDGDAVHVGGPELTRSQKFRNVRADPRVSFVVDDQADEPNAVGQHGRGVEIRGLVEIVTLDQPLLPGFARETFRIHPLRVVAWNLGEPSAAPSPGRPEHLQGYTFRDAP